VVFGQLDQTGQDLARACRRAARPDGQVVPELKGSLVVAGPLAVERQQELEARPVGRSVRRPTEGGFEASASLGPQPELLVEAGYRQELIRVESSPQRIGQTAAEVARQGGEAEQVVPIVTEDARERRDLAPLQIGAVEAGDSPGG